MTERRGTMIAAGAGVLFPFLAVSRVLYSGEIDLPNWDGPAADIADYFSRASFDFVFVLGMFSALAGYLLFMVFMAKVADVFGGEPGNRWISYAIFGGVLLDVLGVQGYIGSLGVAHHLAGSADSSSDSVLLAYNMSYGFYWVDLAATALWATILGFAILVQGRFPRWFGGVLIATAMAQIVIFFLPADAWNISGILYLWELVLAAYMLLKPARFSTEPHGHRFVEPKPAG